MVKLSHPYMSTGKAILPYQSVTSGFPDLVKWPGIIFLPSLLLLLLLSHFSRVRLCVIP